MSETLAEVGSESLVYLHYFTSEWTTALSGIRKFDVFDWKVCTHHNPPTQPTPLRKVVWNIRESCGRPRSTQTLDFLTRWHCVRQTDVNSWKRDTCVRFMCCLLDDVWDCLKRFKIDTCCDGSVMRKWGRGRQRNTLTQFVASCLSHTMFLVCLILYYRFKSQYVEK